MTGQELKDLRIKSGYTSQEFAKMLGLKGDRTLRRWELGTRTIPEPMQILIRSVLKVK